MFLWAWGKLLYGEWLTLYAVIAYLPLVDMGMQKYVINRLTHAYSRGDLKEYTKVLHSALWLYLIIITLFVVILVLFVFFVPFTKWMNIIIADEKMVKISAFILGCYLLLGIPLGLLCGLYHTFGEFPRRAMLLNIKEIFIIFLLAGALFLRSNFVIVSAIQFIPVLFLIFFILLDIKRRHSEIKFGFFAADWKFSLSFIGPGILFLMIVLSNALKIQGSVLIISASLGATAVATFCIHRTLANAILKIVGSIKNAIWPELTAIEARKDFSKMQLVHSLLIKFSFFIAFSCAIFLFFTGGDIIKMWTQKKILFQPMLWTLLLLYLPWNVLWETSAIFQISINRHRKYSLCRITSTILGLILAMILIKTWGIVGVFLGFIIPEFIICITIIPAETLKIINVTKINFWLNIVGKGFIIVFPQILVGLVLSYYSLNVFLQGFLLIIGIFFVGGIIGYLFWLTNEEKKRILQLIKGCL